MLDFFKELDLTLLYAINHTELPGFFHAFLIELTTANNSKWFFFIAVPTFLIFLILRHRWLGVKIIFMTAALAGIADTFNYRVIKSFVHRVRPHSSLNDVLLRVPYGPKSSSFPSNHATTTMALAIWLSYLFPKATPFFLLISFLTGYSRVYVGVHYPSDVIGGWIIGTLLGLGAIWIYRRFIQRTARP